MPLGTNLLAPPWICPGILSRFGLGAALAKARAEAAKVGDQGRSWLPIGGNDDDENNAKQKQQIQQQRSQPPPPKLSTDNTTTADLPPGLPLDKGNKQGDKQRSRSRTPTTEDKKNLALSPTAADFMAPPDMSERQKEIQSSLFKMLGQHE